MNIDPTLTIEMQSQKKSGIALRPSVIPPNEIVKLVKVIDQSVISHIFIPDLPGGFDSLEVSSACLGVSKGLRIGSGVFRLLEYDILQLGRRVETLQSVSDNRFILGIGTGDPGQNPARKISDLLQRVSELRNNFSEKNVAFPETFVATLRAGIAKRVAGKVDGILLNFCPPDHAKKVVESVRRSFAGKIETACYLKVFFSESVLTAKKLAIEEFVKYDTLGHYHKMFELSGLSDEIRTAARSLQDKEMYYSDKLARTSPVNPNKVELQNYIKKFREAGITLPCVYPYFAPYEGFEHKVNTIQKIISAVE